MDLQVDQADCCGCFRLHSLPEIPSPVACSVKPAPIARLTKTMFRRSSIQTFFFSFRLDRKKATRFFAKSARSNSLLVTHVPLSFQKEPLDLDFTLSLLFSPPNTPPPILSFYVSSSVLKQRLVMQAQPGRLRHSKSQHPARSAPAFDA
jgi:hypothetical protein